ncbi:serine/threonine-protein kinase [Roseimaritima ulvae]|uniref:Serine/threonine-protein kinase PrkC n=1 Tax=Roseimaritima ulvae TaxID=980254 RepID=A0A5B9R7Z7_9BACT|nr:serine/threonine-protein kinase [Roseimaritima ulvae]QEG42653.1 Serine/threonine-protein kinase PrkC [Roseimaritima ulvae]
MNSDAQSIYLIDCPHCDQAMRVDVEAIGRAGLCPACQQRVPVVSVRAGVAADSGLERIASLSSSRTDSGSAGSWTSPGSRTSSSAAGSQPQRPSAAATLGRFALQKKLGQGGFGEVWLAEDTQLKRLVALKLPRFAAQDEKRRRRFLAESKTAAVLRHPNIVPVLDAGKLDDTLFIASEFVRGVPLNEIHKDRPASVQWTVQTLIKLARATHFAHQHQIIHRDLKPDNVLIDQQGQPQVLDFGLAKRLDDTEARTMDGTVMGTPQYMSPEQARGEIARIGPASDQFSLGVILYRLLVGQAPHGGPPLVVLKQLIADPTPSLAATSPSFPADLVAICDQARAAEIEHRYPDCEALADDLQRFLDGQPVRARPPAWYSRAFQWMTNHPRESSLTVVCVLSALMLFAVSLVGWRRAQRAADQAGITEGQLQEETARLIGLEQALAMKVDEAAQLRDRTAAAQQRAVAARQQLETETDRLDAQTQQAEQSLAKLQQTTQQLLAQQQQQQTVESTLEEATQTLEETTSTVKQIRSEYVDKSRYRTDFSPAELALTKDVEDGVLCKVGDEAFVLKPSTPLTISPVSVNANPRGVKQIRIDSQDQVIGGWGSGSTDRMGIAKLAAGNQWQSLVPIRYGQGMSELKKQSPQQFRALLVQGYLPSFTGEFAIDSQDRVYVYTRYGRNFPPIRFDPLLQRFDVLPQIDDLHEIHFRADDAAGIYFVRGSSNYYVERRDLEDDLDKPGTVALVLKSQKGVVREATPLAEDQWLIRLHGFQWLLLDLPARTYQPIELQARFRRVKSYLHWTVTPEGNLVSVSSQSITFFQYDD